MSSLSRKFFVVITIIAAVFFPVSRFCHADELKLTPSISLEEEYNDNIFYDEDNKVGDFIFTVTPGLNLDHKSDRYSSRLDARLSDYRYADNPDLDDSDVFCDGNADYQWTYRLDSSLYAGFSRTSQPDRDFETTGILLGTYSRERYKGGASLNYALSEKTSTGISYDYGQDDYEDEAVQNGDYNDYKSHSARIYLQQNLESYLKNTVGMIDARYSHYDYTTYFFNLYSSTIGLSHSLNEKITISAYVGANKTFLNYETQVPQFDPNYGLIWVRKEKTDDEWGWIGQASLSYSGEYTNYSLHLSRDMSAASERGSINERTSVELKIGRRITEDLGCRFAAKYFLNDTFYRDSSGRSDIEEESFRLQPGLSYKITRDIKMDMRYSYYSLVNRETNDTKQRNSVFIRFTYQYQWIL